VILSESDRLMVSLSVLLFVLVLHCDVMSEAWT